MIETDKNINTYFNILNVIYWLMIITLITLNWGSFELFYNPKQPQNLIFFFNLIHVDFILGIFSLVILLFIWKIQRCLYNPQQLEDLAKKIPLPIPENLDPHERTRFLLASAFFTRSLLSYLLCEGLTILGIISLNLTNRLIPLSFTFLISILTLIYIKPRKRKLNALFSSHFSNNS